MSKKKCISKLNLEIDTSELGPQQVRIIRSLMTHLVHMMVTDEESEFFEGSADLMKLVAACVKQSNFETIWQKESEIEYATQALEFCMDFLGEELVSDDVVRFDN